MKFSKARPSLIQRVFAVPVLLGLFLVSGCGGGSDSSNAEIPSQPVANPPPSLPESSETAPVYFSPSFAVEVTLNVKYGEGLSHSDWNSDSAIPMDLLLDVYTPENDEVKRPVAVFIHGGGFRGGDKSFSRASDFMHFFAERGFVGFSINYRLLSDYGTIPAQLDELVNNMTQLTQDDRDQIKAIYPANRDAKAAIRWLYANAETLGIDTDHITVIGGSAGSLISVALGVTDSIDFHTELSLHQDPTLATTNTDYPAQIHTIVDHWGSGGAVELINTTYGVNRWDATDAPISIVHGTEDATVLFEEAVNLRELYSQTGATFAFYPLQGAGHGAWSATVDGQTLPELAFAFVLQTQTLQLIE